MKQLNLKKQLFLLLAAGMASVLTAQSPVVQTFSYTGSIVDFTVPSCVSSISMQAWGAQGGSIPGYPGGLGAYMSGVFTVSAGQVLRVLVGGQGVDLSTTPSATGGGGGSFVALLGAGTPTPMLVAGGGGGRRNISSGPSANADGVITQNGMPSFDNSGAGGTAGNGGLSGEPSGNGTGGPGGGFYTNGGPCGIATPPQPGFAFVNGGTIANTCSPFTSGTSSNGGFGGGGGGCWCFRGTPGGGGGYSGGGTGVNDNAGGGGGSFNSGTSQVNTPGIRSGNGQVIFTYNFNGAGVLATMSNTAGLCAGGSITLMASNVLTYTWSNNSNATAITVSPNVTTSYTVQGTNNLGCISEAVLTVSINPLPDIQIANSNSVLCVGNMATLTATGADTYVWSNNMNGPVISVGPLVTTTYSVAGTSTAGCVSVTPVVVVVNSNSLTVTPSTAVCAGDNIVLSASGANTYTWNTGSLFNVNTVAPTVATVYTVMGIDIHQCLLSNVVAVAVNQKPNVAASPNKPTICKGEAVSLNATGATTYTWNNGDTGAQVTYTLPIDIDYYYSVTGTDNNNCVNTASVTVKVSRCTGLDKGAGLLMPSKVFPNPNTGKCTVELSADPGKCNLDIYNSIGQLVRSYEVQGKSVEVNLESEAAGIYFVFISNKQTTVKITEIIRN